MEKNVPVNISIGDFQYSCTVDESWAKIITHITTGFVESENKIKDLTFDFLGAVIQSQIPKNNPKNDKSPLTYKLLLSTEIAKNKDILTHRVKNAYDLLIDQKFIDGSFSDFKTIFLPGLKLNRKVRWTRDRIELKYLVCKLSGKKFKEVINRVERVSLLDNGETVFFDNNEIFLKAENSFLSKQGKLIPYRGVSNPRTHAFLSDEKKALLDRIAKKFMKE